MNEDVINLLGQIHNEAGKLGGSYEVGRIQMLASSAQQKLIEQSSGIMPKVFDGWRNAVVVDNDEHPEYELIGALYNIGVNEYAPIDKALYDWIMKDMNNRFRRCIEAIIHGYEVEK